MRFARSTLTAVFTGALFSGALAATALAVPAAAESPRLDLDGQVAVFTHELTPLTVYEDPEGCHELPTGAHVIANLTDGPITIYYDPFCTLPIDPVATIDSGYGSHVSAVGSFSA